VLRRYDGRARLIAGGTDLILQLREEGQGLTALVDITRIPELTAIREEGGYLVIGACVTHRQASESPLIRERALALAQACRSVGSLQVRNVGTIAGNVVNAQPAADSAIALLALGAEAQVADAEGRRWLPLEELYEGPGRSRVDPTRQMVTFFRLPLPEGPYASAFRRLARRRALILPILNTAVALALRPQEPVVERARIAIGPVAPVPFRAREAERLLEGAPLEEGILERAAEAASGEARPRTSLLRGSAEYRKEMVRVLVKRALKEAANRLLH